MAESLLESLECKVCFEYYQIPIRQCVKGHSFCSKCFKPDKGCPMCRQPISEARSFALEELVENTALPCENKSLGCRFMLNRAKMSLHKVECQFRKLICEGKNFCEWDCNWSGQDIQEHFKSKHFGHTKLQFSSIISVGYNDTTNFTDIQLISAHYHLFWYKHKIDLTSKKAYWAFQIIGPKSVASKFYYEFEFIADAPSMKKFKVTEYCDNDVEDINKIFESEKCVVISLKALKHFVKKNNEYCFRYRLMRLKTEDGKKNTPKK